MKTKEQQLIEEGIDAYAILDLKPSVGAQGIGINQAYNKAIKNAGEDRAKNEEINIALKILQDPTLKIAHDEALGYGKKWQDTINTSTHRSVSDQDFKKFGKTSTQAAKVVDPKLVEEVKKEQAAAQSKIQTAVENRQKAAQAEKKEVTQSSNVNSTLAKRISDQKRAQNNAATKNAARKAEKKAQSDKEAEKKAKSDKETEEKANAQNTRERANSEPITKQSHLSGADLRQAIINNRNRWQKFTAWKRGNSGDLTANETEAHKQLESAKKVISGDRNSNDVIQNTLKDVRKKTRSHSI